MSVDMATARNGFFVKGNFERQSDKAKKKKENIFINMISTYIYIYILFF